MECRFIVSALAPSVIVLLLAGCGGHATRSDVTHSGGPPDAVPKVEPKSKYGNMETYQVLGKTYRTKSTSKGYVERGQASWYGNKFNGRRTSSGESYDMHQMTAAHKTLPLPCYVRVTNLENGLSTVVRVNDRGPFHRGRIIDLSYAAAKKLGVIASGTATVEVRSVDPRDNGRFADAGPPRNEPFRPVAKPSAVAVASRDDGLYLQVGAFDELANAEQLRHRLLAYVPGSVNILPSAEAELAPYKVRVGPLQSRAEAEAVSRQLAELGVMQGAVVIR